MDICLSQNEARVIGCLIEKEITTPEQYPLSLNALTNACNQKSNREPVLALDEATVQQSLDALVKAHLVSEKSGFGSRIAKYQHRFCNTEFSALQLPEQALGIICVLLLRGAQTPGELRTRTNRLCKFSDVNEVETTLAQLATRSDGPFVVKLTREPGRRESRFAHLFSGEVTLEQTQVMVPEMGQALSSSDIGRIDLLEQQVAELQLEMRQLKEKLADLL